MQQEQYDAKSVSKVILPDGEWDGGMCSEKTCSVPFNDFRYKFKLDKNLIASNAPCKVNVMGSFAYITLEKKNARKK